MAKAATGRDNLVGSLLMILSMAGFAIEDALLKLGAKHLPLGQVVTITGLAGMTVFAALIVINGQPLVTRAYFSRTMRIRAVFEITGRTAYTAAFILSPIISATAILQATPLIVVAGAALFLGEKVGWRRWTAILVGLVGVMLILRPWSAAFDIMSILAVIGMIGFAGRDLATRASPPHLSNFQLGLNGYAMLTIAGLIIWTFDLRALPMSAGQAGVLSLAITGGIVGYYALTIAMRRGDVAAVTPWRYSRLIFGAILGVLLFGEGLPALTLIGSVIVVASGVFTLLRVRRT